MKEVVHQVMRAFREGAGEPLEYMKMESWLEEFPVCPPRYHVSCDQPLAEEIVQQLIEEYLARVLHAAEDHLDVLRLHDHHVRQSCQPDLDHAPIILALVG